MLLSVSFAGIKEQKISDVGRKTTQWMDFRSLDSCNMVVDHGLVNVPLLSQLDLVNSVKCT